LPQLTTLPHTGNIRRSWRGKCVDGENKKENTKDEAEMKGIEEEINEEKRKKKLLN
jgi:hypothetical protein